ncbi:MAG: hypothetical protein RLZZ22_1880 [Pseudomonadota bacterium]
MNSSKKIKSELAGDKDKKPKLVRDSFTIPKDEYAAIETLKARALTLGLAIKKSELMRAGLMALTSLSDAKLKTALVAVPTLKTGRPSAQASSAQAAFEAEAPAPVTSEAPAAAPEAPAPVAVKAPVARKSRKPKAASGEAPASHSA